MRDIPAAFMTLLLLALAAGNLYGQSTSDSTPLLDVSIGVFAQNLSGDSQTQQQADIFPAVRQAESRYLPSFLKLMLEESGQWGAVRLLPEEDPGAEVQIMAVIVSSDGSQLALDLRAIDATGRVWLDKRYTGYAVESVSLTQSTLATDPFYYLYSEITGDLALIYQNLSPTQINEIKAVAMLRYGLTLSPEVFSQYLTQNDTGFHSLVRFPANNDPFLLRVREIREHEYVFIDVVDEQYENFFVGIKPVYDLWRRYRREQQTSEAGKIEREASQTNEFSRGSYMSLLESYNNYRWSRMQDQYLDEINEGFINEVLPTDINLEDSLYTLTGTLTDQYREWRDILKELYALESLSGP